MYLAVLRRQDLAWLLGSLCQYHRIPFDPVRLLQQFPAPHTVGQFFEAARALGFKMGDIEPRRMRPAQLPCPFVAFFKSGDATASADASTTEPVQSARPLLVMKADDRRVMYFAAGSPHPETAPVEAFERLVHPFLVLVRHEPPDKPPMADPGGGSRRAFGFGWFRTELLKHKGTWRDLLLASLFIQAIGLATPLFTQVVIDKVVVHHTSSTLIAVVFGLAMFAIFGAVMSWLRQYLLLHTGNRIDAGLGSAVFAHLLSVALPYFEHRPTGTLVARLHAVETIRDFMAGAALALLLDLPFLCVFIAVMFAYSWQLTLIALGMLGVLCVLSAAVAPVLRSRVNDQFLIGARNQAFVTEYVAGMETVKSLQMEPRLQARYEELFAAYLSAGFATRQISNTYNVVANTVEQAMSIALLCVGALLVMRNDGFTVGMLVAFQMFAGRMSQPMLRLAGLWHEFQQASIAVKRLGDIMDAPAERRELARSRPTRGSGEIVVSHLSFRYSAVHPYVYRDLNLTIKPRKVTVLTGPSGCGKSTFAKILLGFYVPEEGNVLIDGIDIRHLATNELRQNFGIVPQETYLFSGSIYDNLVAANPEAAFEDVVLACKIAEIHEFVEKLPRGYNEILGEHGVGLSGGQKQRLAIARALLKRPRVLIFDEATSNLDPATAEQFARTINQLKGKVTMLFIAHQVPAALSVDEVINLKNQTEQNSAPAPQMEET